MKRVPLLITLSLLSLGLMAVGCSEEPAEKQAPAEMRPLPVQYFQIEEENIPIWVEFTGKTEASKRVEVRARVAGRLEEILFNEGAQVEKGEQLFTIEKATYEAALATEMAALAGHEASLKLARADVKRYEPLVVEGLAPRVNLEQAEARAAELEAAIQGDQAKIRDAKLNLSYTTVVAPISGKISRKFVDVGNIVGYGEKTVLTTITLDDPMYAYFNPPERSFQIMSKYKSRDVMEANVRVAGENHRLLTKTIYKGGVDFADNRVDRNTSTITMRAEIGNPEHDLLEGTFVYVDVFITDKAAFRMVIPEAVQEDQRGSYVYVVDEQNMAKRVDITRGFETRNYLVVPEGLDIGDKVIISGLAKVREGGKLAPEDVTLSKGVMARLKQEDMIPTK